MEHSKARGCLSMKIKISILEIGLTAGLKEEAHSITIKAWSIMGNGVTMKCTAEENKSGLMALFLVAFFKKDVKCRESSPGQQVTSTKANFKTTRFRDSESIHGAMEGTIRGNGKIT